MACTKAISRVPAKVEQRECKCNFDLLPSLPLVLVRPLDHLLRDLSVTAFSVSLMASKSCPEKFSLTNSCAAALSYRVTQLSLGLRDPHREEGLVGS